jgi:hypothetical protein
VSTLEDRVRDALRADADLVAPESIPAGPPPRPARSSPGRPWSRRAHLLIPLGAAAAVIATVAGISLAVPRPGASTPLVGPAGSTLSPTPAPVQATPIAPYSPAPRPAPLPVLAADASRGVPAAPATAGVPRFYVTVDIPPVGGVDYIVVRDTATGQVTGRINPPGNTVFAGLAATAGDRTFITTIDPDTGCSPVQLYQFRLNALGAPGPLEPLHIALPGGVPQGGGDLAVTPDGGTIAYESDACPTTLGETEVGVISLATRLARAWAAPLGLANPAGSQIMDVSLSADGGLLGFATVDGTRVLPTSAPAGSLFTRSQLVSGTVIWAAIAGDGDALYGCAVSPFRSGGMIPGVGTLTYGRIPLTGGASQVIASWRDVTGPQCYASLDPAGNYLLVQFPTTVPNASDWSRPAILDLRTGQLTDINAPAFYGPFDIAW